MSVMERIYGCELIAQNLERQLERFDAKTPEWGRVYLSLLEHLAYTQMVIERHLAQLPRRGRAVEEQRIAAVAPTFSRLKRVCAVSPGEVASGSEV